jgi:hypothetical protein
MTGTNFLNTPDGRPGWGDFFLSKGYEVSGVNAEGGLRAFLTIHIQRFTSWTSQSVGGQLTR